MRHLAQARQRLQYFCIGLRQPQVVIQVDHEAGQRGGGGEGAWQAGKPVVADVQEL